MQARMDPISLWAASIGSAAGCGRVCGAYTGCFCDAFVGATNRDRYGEAGREYVTPDTS
jgi:hypothetical protein